MRGVCVDGGVGWRNGGWGRGVVVEGVMLWYDVALRV